MLNVLQTEHYPFAAAAEMGEVYDWLPERRIQARSTLDSFLLDEFRSIQVERVLVEGDPAIKIVELAHSDKADLIVMPTHGYGPFRKFILGSVTAKVLHDADCPVLTGVHMQDSPPPATTLFRKILCAVDLGPQSPKALEWAAQMAAETGAELRIVHALPAPDFGEARYFDQDWRRAIEQMARQRIADLQENAGTHAEVIFDSGQAATVVHHVAEATNADLVVIGRHVGSGLLGRLRAHAYAIIRESPCPVVSV
jgi:nucleotide-binding universal stress UspA family protein